MHALKAPFQVPDVDLDILSNRLGAGSSELRRMTAILLTRQLGVELVDAAVDRLQFKNLRRRRLPARKRHPLQEIQHHARIQCVGLAPLHARSSKILDRPRRISKVGNRHLRAALYMPALVAIQHEPNVKAFYSKLVAAGKRPMQAVVAVMRKLLHAIWGMLKHDQDFDGNKFFKLAEKTA